MDKQDHSESLCYHHPIRRSLILIGTSLRRTGLKSLLQRGREWSRLRPRLELGVAEKYMLQEEAESKVGRVLEKPQAHWVCAKELVLCHLHPDLLRVGLGSCRMPSERFITYAQKAQAPS